jgi:hypothetical protein
MQNRRLSVAKLFSDFMIDTPAEIWSKLLFQWAIDVDLDLSAFFIDQRIFPVRHIVSILCIIYEYLWGY